MASLSPDACNMCCMMHVYPPEGDWEMASLSPDVCNMCCMVHMYPQGVRLLL